MLTISRSILRRFRALCRRGGLHKTGPTGCVVTLVGGPDGCRIQASSPDVAIEYHQPAPCEVRTIRLPFNALEICEGRDESPVTITVRPDDSVELAWNDHGVPRSLEQIQPKPKGEEFPVWPNTTSANASDLWQALADGVATTDPNSSRYALGCLHLRGAAGSVEATDGRQVLTQSGYQFGFKEDVLVPATKLLGCADLNAPGGFRVGRNEKYVGIELGSWRLMLRIQDGRFPKLDQVLPSGVAVKSTLELGTNDARYLLDAMPRLPCHDAIHQPLTLDLNGKVLIRCREADKARPTELQLGASKLVGQPIVFNTNRRYVERALRLGFHSIGLFGPESPVLCDDGRRRFVWMLLDKDSLIPRHTDPVRIGPVANESGAAIRVSPAVKSNHRTTSSEVAMSPPTHHESAVVPMNRTTDVKFGCGRPSTSTIEQAVALRDAIRMVAARAGELVRSLKRQRRQAKIVESTLASLKQLQKVAG